MAWSTNTEKVTVVSGLTQDAKTKYNTWMKAIKGSTTPQTAAKGWDSDYEVLKTTTETRNKKPVKLKLCSVRLTQEHRVYFVQDDAAQICTVKKVGSHVKPTGF